jgi:hydroxypyruvate reductase
MESFCAAVFLRRIMKELRKQAEYITEKAIWAVLPDEAVKRALEGRDFSGRVLMVAIGKAAWQMAKTAREILGDHMDSGIVITKYGHVKGTIDGCECFEAGHPVPDENSFAGTRAALDLVRGLGPADTVLFLLSGGGSALFEDPLVPPDELADITRQLLACGADIVEANTVRKRRDGNSLRGRTARYDALCADFA